MRFEFEVDDVWVAIAALAVAMSVGSLVVYHLTKLN